MSELGLQFEETKRRKEKRERKQPMVLMARRGTVMLKSSMKISGRIKTTLARPSQPRRSNSKQDQQIFRASISFGDEASGRPVVGTTHCDADFTRTSAS